MIWIVSGLILGLVVGWAMVEDPEGLVDWVVCIFSSAVIGAAGAVVGGIIALVCSSLISVDVVVVDGPKEYLAALGTKQGIEGSFFLGSGLVGSEMTYHYIIHAENGGFRLKSLGAKKALILEDGEERPYIVTRQMKIAKSWGNTARLLISLPYFEDTYDFHIPKGSVLTGYTVDVR